MTKKDFFRIIIKLFGLYSLISTVFYLLPSQIAILSYDLSITSVLLITGVFVVSIGLLVLLIYKTDTIINGLNLDKGFDEEKIQFDRFNELNIIKLALLLIGAYMLLDNIAALLKNSYYALQYDNQSYSDGLYFGVENQFEWAVNFINVFTGYLIVTNYSWLAEKLTQVKATKNV